MAASCSQCGTPVALPSSELDGLPSPQSVSVLCSTCSSTASPTDAHQGAGLTRTFRVTFVLQEWEGPTTDTPQSGDVDQEQHAEESQWVDIGRFSLRGANSSLADFIDKQSAEFQRRMQMILDFADTEPDSAPQDQPPSPAEPPGAPPEGEGDPGP